MKTKVSILIVTLITAFLILNACTKKKNITLSDRAEITHLIVKNGILYFADSLAMQTTLVQIENYTIEQIQQWEKKLGFRSIRSYQIEAENLIFENIDDILRKKSNISEKSLQEKCLKGEINEIPSIAQKIIDECRLQIIENSDGTKELRPSEPSSISYFLLNKDYAFAIGKTIHTFKNSKELVYPDLQTYQNSRLLKSSNDINLRNNIYLLDNTQSYSRNFRRLTATLYAQRVIYWSDAELDPWSVTSLFIQYTAQNKRHFWWGYRHKALYIYGSGNYEKGCNYKGNSGNFQLYSETIFETKTSPYFIVHWWQFDGDFPWIAFKNTNMNLYLKDDSNVHITFKQAKGTNKNPCYLYNLQAKVYKRHEYTSPGDIN